LDLVQYLGHKIDALIDTAIKEFSEYQLILLDHSKEKYTHSIDKINYIHFTKNNEFGRYGFVQNKS